MVNTIPHSLNEALTLLSEGGLRPYGGGTDLMVPEERQEEYLFLHRVEELKEMADDGTYVRIGAECTFSQIEEQGAAVPLLRDAVSQIAAPAIRNLGTIGGNVGNGSAKADSALALFALGAIVRVVSLRGERLIPIHEFYLGRKKLDLRADELIAEFLIPKKHIGSYYYEKVGARKALAISRVSFAGVLVEKYGVITYCATAFGAINDRIVSLPHIDGLLLGSTRKEAAACRKVYFDAMRRELNPQDGRISADYRKAVCMNLLEAFWDSCVAEG